MVWENKKVVLKYSETKTAGRNGADKQGFGGTMCTYAGGQVGELQELCKSWEEAGQEEGG